MHVFAWEAATPRQGCKEFCIRPHTLRQHHLWDDKKICKTEKLYILPLFLLAQGYAWEIAAAEGSWGLDKVLHVKADTY